MWLHWLFHFLRILFLKEMVKNPFSFSLFLFLNSLTFLSYLSVWNTPSPLQAPVGGKK
jgi:hypothetical protein